MTKPTLDEIIKNLVAGAMEFQNPNAVTREGSLKAIGPKTAKQQLTQLIADIIGEDLSTKLLDGEATKFANGYNDAKLHQRQRAKARGVDL